MFLFHSAGSIWANALLISLAGAASLQPVKDFGPNPSKISMNIYVPDKLGAKPPIVVAVSFHQILLLLFTHFHND
jgi:hypothetical protein